MNPVAEAFHPGEFIQEELDARGWTHQDLATHSGIPFRDIVELCDGDRPVTLSIASGLEKAFAGPDALFWLGLQKSYDRHQEEAT